jgi:hypothetical protein
MDGFSVEIVASQIFPVKFQSFVRVNKETEIGVVQNLAQNSHLFQD